MENLVTAPNITFAVGMLSILFSVYNYFRNPQIKSEKNDEVMDLKMKWSLEASDKRFAEIQTSVREAFSLAQNHTHSVETKVDVLRVTVETMGKDIVKLATIIEERMPKK